MILIVNKKGSEKIKSIACIVLIYLILPVFLFSFFTDDENSLFLNKKNILLAFPTIRFSMELFPGNHIITLHDDAGDFDIPIEVTNDYKQQFTFFLPEDLCLKIRNKDQTERIAYIDLSAIAFVKYNSIPIGVKKNILICDNVLENEGMFKINGPIQNNSVNNYMLTINMCGNVYKKYLILNEGVAEFLKFYNPLMFEGKEDKKISLFESEWVASQKIDSEILYRDEKQIRSIIINSQPDTAAIYIGNELIGFTSHEIFIISDDIIELIISKKGYCDSYLEISTEDNSQEFLINLEERKPETEIEL